MPARSASDVLDRLRRNPPNLWADGEQVKDPVTHPATGNGAQSLAALYDLQHEPDLVDTMTFKSPSTGDRVGMSFIVPETRDDLERRSDMHRVWANAHLGFMGRAPDYLNVNVMAAGMAPDYFSQCRPEFGANIANYFEYVREHDLCLTHALTNPQVDRAKRDSELDDPYIALGVVREQSDGIVVRGARMLATLPISDEILIFPSTVLQRGDDMQPYAMAFAIPNDTPGLIFQCREPLDRGPYQQAVGGSGKNLPGAMLMEDLGCRADRTSRADHVVEHQTDLPIDGAADDRVLTDLGRAAP